ncbi:hypothetical protein [Mesorhizobium sp. M0159]|uniref:hypothetical protein n=1 Tax=Mesorhizobium sp. M0159 TaxID=2956900 RepID=UPI0033383DBC
MKSKPSEVADDSMQLGMSPSQFMRQLRPEYYSDTSDRSAYVLDGPTLSFHLDTITDRNQTQGFELFCRKLCERAICPNLRPQTGPEGGGDSKVDSETYPVSDEISQTYIGDLKAAGERWAFAFSAKKTWADKVRKDVKGIIDTGRKYDRIICVTSRPARSKDRARLEDELLDTGGVSVTIQDRSWIAKEIIENDRKDIAFNYLGVGQEITDRLRLGPADYSRTQQLEDAEAALSNPEAFTGLEVQRASEALIAAKLSRGLERARTDTDGRFLRAIRFAKDGGTFRQQLEARYEYLWTAIWWYDDLALANESYDDLADFALKADSAKNVEFLCNLMQAFCSAVIHGHLTREDVKFDERTNALIAALEDMAADRNRPNNRLESQISLLLLKMNIELLNSNREALSEIWKSFSEVLVDARGLGEFDAERFIKLVGVTGMIAVSDPSYGQLVEDVAAFVSERKSEGEGALILLARASKLDLTKPFEIIRLAGKAAIQLTKKEYADSLIEALRLLTLAYRSAGMLWAARASCIFLAASLVIEGEEESEIPVAFIPTMKMFAWIALELRCVPDFLNAIRLLNGSLRSIPLTDESKKALYNEIRELEYAFACQLLNLDDEQLEKLEALPDVLEALGLMLARSALLFALGHRELLRLDGSLPPEESDEDIDRMFSILMSQPVADSIAGVLVLNGDKPETISTSIMGMRIDVATLGNEASSLLAQTLVGALEAFFATALDADLVPHTEIVEITLQFTEDGAAPVFIFDPMTMKSKLHWPLGLSLTSFDNQRVVQDLLAVVASRILATAFLIQRPKDFIEQLFVGEAIMNRATMVAVSPNSYHRVLNEHIGSLKNWKRDGHRSYSAGERPSLPRIDFHQEEETESSHERPVREGPPKITDHRKMGIKSVIDIHSWDEATWRGTAYIQFDPRVPPAMALLFENRAAAISIFERWRERVGEEDKDEAIRISIIRNLPSQPPCHYTVMITANPDKEDFKKQDTVIIASRMRTMQPDDDVNLQRFLRSYEHFKAYLLMPAIFDGAGAPDPLSELTILKREIIVRNADDVGEHDVDHMALRSHLAPPRKPKD